jgi:hypothetical protein
MDKVLAFSGDICIRINNLFGTRHGVSIVLGLLVLLSFSGFIGTIVSSVSEQYTNLCEIARERSGAVTTVDQNRCNGTTDGRLMSGDWACRNDGYSGYNVASVGE